MRDDDKDAPENDGAAAKKTGAGATSEVTKTRIPDTDWNTKRVIKKAAAVKNVPAKKATVKRASSKKRGTGKTQSATMQRSSGAAAKRTFPVYGLEDCYNLCSVIREYNAGNPWSPKEIAAALSIGTGSNFYYLTAASRDYGITVGTRDTAKIELTELGRKVVYPKSPAEFAEAMTTAFRNIALFAKVYDYYQGRNLPEIHYLKNTLKTEFGVEERFQDEFYELFQKNLAYLKAKTGELPTAVRDKGTSGSIGQSDSIILGESSDSGALVAFVAMPFSEKTSNFPKGYFDEVLKHLITPAAVKANFNARTAKKAGSEVIQSTIVNDLDSADLVIVDLTEHNPNVLFELGMRIAFDKPVCLIRAKGTAPIFDIDHMLRVYDYNPSMWPSTLEADIPALSAHIAETWKQRDADRSYLKILRDNKGA